MPQKETNDIKDIKEKGKMAITTTTTTSLG